jgi:biotin transport system substrate-specific component
MAMQGAALRIDRRRVLADLLPGELLRDLVVVVAAAAVVGLLAQLSIPLGFTPVPITGQTLGVLLAGSALGWRRASAALTLYLVAGLAGVPWFAGHQAGNPGVDLGYLIGFVVAAAACGWLAERGADRRVLRALPAMVAGEVCIYAIGVPYLALSLHVSLARAIALGCTPFLLGDALKAAVAAGLLPATWRAIGLKRR